MALLDDQMQLDEPNLSGLDNSTPKIHADFETKPIIALYDSPETDPTALVIVEAKKYGEAMQGIPQCIAYMGVVHQQRKEADKANCEVFGFATDGYEFFFMKIDEHSRLLCADKLNWRIREERGPCYSAFRSIVHHTGVRSPMHSRQITSDM
ncbi:hypothetical protein BDW62DRAFT_201951 [Aspergillus aurantiobrunneus]